MTDHEAEKVADRWEQWSRLHPSSGGIQQVLPGSLLLAPPQELGGIKVDVGNDAGRPGPTQMGH